MSKINILQLILAVLLNFIFIPKFGIIAAAINVLISRVILICITGSLFLKEKKAIN